MIVWTNIGTSTCSWTCKHILSLTIYISHAKHTITSIRWVAECATHFVDTLSDTHKFY